MNKTIDFLAGIYGKIIKGTASDEEKVIYESTIAISCIQEEVLIKAIMQRAKELDKN